MKEADGASCLPCACPGEPADAKHRLISMARLARLGPPVPRSTERVGDLHRIIIVNVQETAMIQKLLSAFLSISLISMLSIGAATADDESKSATEATFKSLDKDTDQRLSKTEVAKNTMLTEHFAAADADSDGYLSSMEYSAHLKAMKSSDTPKKDY